MPITILFGPNNARTVIDSRTLAEAQAERIEEIKAEASARILAVAPLYRQMNATRRAVELLDIRTGRA